MTAGRKERLQRGKALLRERSRLERAKERSLVLGAGSGAAGLFFISLPSSLETMLLILGCLALSAYWLHQALVRIRGRIDEIQRDVHELAEGRTDGA